METLSVRNFGLLIAYIIPGFITVNGLAFHSERIQLWLGNLATNDGPTVGGFLFLTLAAVFAGLIASTIRWLLIDRLLHVTGIRQPEWDFRYLSKNLPAFETLIEIHYRYYQFYSNSLVALVFYSGMRWTYRGGTGLEIFGFALLFLVLFLGARDTLSKYYRRVDDFLGPDTG